MIKWIKNLFVSKRLEAANKRIEELETEVSMLKAKLSLVKDTLIPNFTNEVLDAQSAIRRQKDVAFCTPNCK